MHIRCLLSYLPYNGSTAGKINIQTRSYFWGPAAFERKDLKNGTRKRFAHRYPTTSGSMQQKGDMMCIFHKFFYHNKAMYMEEEWKLSLLKLPINALQTELDEVCQSFAPLRFVVIAVVVVSGEMS